MSCKMTWKVYRHDFNKGIIYEYDLFKDKRVIEDIQRLFEEGNTKEEFSEKLRDQLKYYYWGKSEHEIIITSWVPHISKKEFNRVVADYNEYRNKWGKDPICFSINPEVAEKVSVYDQLRLNWDVFVDYVWSFKEEQNEV